MATVKGIFGQDAPSATTLEDLYTVPAGKNATVKVIVTNRASAATSFRIAIAVDGAADSLEQYIVYDKAIAGNDTGATETFVLGGDDVLRIYAGNGNLSFACTGFEQDD
jgi:hypothetical protein